MNKNKKDKDKDKDKDEPKSDPKMDLIMGLLGQGASVFQKAGQQASQKADQQADQQADQELRETVGGVRDILKQSIPGTKDGSSDIESGGSSGKSVSVSEKDKANQELLGLIKDDP